MSGWRPYVGRASIALPPRLKGGCLSRSTSLTPITPSQFRYRSTITHFLAFSDKTERVLGSRHKRRTSLDLGKRRDFEIGDGARVNHPSTVARTKHASERRGRLWHRRGYRLPRLFDTHAQSNLIRRNGIGISTNKKSMTPMIQILDVRLFRPPSFDRPMPSWRSPVMTKGPLAGDDCLLSQEPIRAEYLEPLASWGSTSAHCCSTSPCFALHSPTPGPL